MNKQEDSSVVLTLINTKRMVNIVEWNFYHVYFPVKTKKKMVHLTLRVLMSYIYGAPILDVSRSHTTAHHSRQDSSGRVISSSQRPLPDNTRHSQQTNIYACGRSPVEIVGSNPTGGMDICLL